MANERHRIPIDLPKDDKGNILWKKVEEYVRSGESLAQKHVAMDRRLKEVSDQLEELKKAKLDYKNISEQFDEQVELRVAEKIANVLKERDDLREEVELRRKIDDIRSEKHGR